VFVLRTQRRVVVQVLRTRPDGANVVPKKSWSEQTMMRRFFSRKYDLPAVGTPRCPGVALCAEPVLRRARVHRRVPGDPEAQGALRARHPPPQCPQLRRASRRPAGTSPGQPCTQQQWGSKPSATTPPLICECYVQACTIALDTGVSEVARIERSRPVIFEGVRSGYKAAFTLLSDDEGADAATDRALPLDAIAEAPELSPDAWLERYRKPHSG
jgi:hypothetical protein